VDIRAEPDITSFESILTTYFLRLAFDLLGLFVYFSPVIGFYSNILLLFFTVAPTFFFSVIGAIQNKFKMMMVMMT